VAFFLRLGLGQFTQRLFQRAPVQLVPVDMAQTANLFPFQPLNQILHIFNIEILGGLNKSFGLFCDDELVIVVPVHEFEEAEAGLLSSDFVLDGKVVDDLFLVGDRDEVVPELLEF
jgi:hypothetical protein